MKLNTRRFPLWCLLLAACAIPASAQWTSTGSSCSSCQVQSNPIITSMPMQTPSYQPMTQFAPVNTTVQTPVPYTQFVNQPVTQMVPVTRQQTVQVPSVQYRTVTQYQTRNRDLGRWRTNYYPTRRVSPCQYDSRPGFMGWMNRTGYGLRNLFTPQYTTRRQYVPNVVAQTVPVRRQVAVPTTRTVAYNVTQMVPRTVNRQVAVSGVRYVAQNFSTMQPVPSIAYAPTPTFSPSVAYAPMAVAPSVAWAPSTTAIASGTTGWDPFGGSLAAAPVVGSVPYDEMAVMTEDEFKRVADRDANMEPIPDDLQTIPRRASRDPRTRTDFDRNDRDFGRGSDDFRKGAARRRTARDEDDSAGMFDDDAVRSRKSDREDYEPGTGRMSELDKKTETIKYRRPAQTQSPTGGFDFGDDDAFFGNDPAPARQPANNGAGARYPQQNDEFIPSSEPTFDDGDAFLDGEADGLDFNDVNNSRFGRPISMKRRSSGRDGWRSASVPRKSRSPKTKPILVSQRNR